MKSVTNHINNIITIVINVFILLTPIFFLPVTREFVIVSKLYFFLFGIIGLLILSFISILVSRHLSWRKDGLVNGLLLFVVASALSVIIMSPNKLQALFLPYGGFMLFVSMVIFYFYATRGIREQRSNVHIYLGIAGAIASIISLVSFLDPFKNIALPAQLAFLKSAGFNPVGSQLDLISFLIFVLVSLVGYMTLKQQSTAVQHTPLATPHVRVKSSNANTLFYVLFTFILVGLVVQTFSVVKALFIDHQSAVLPPLSISWFACIEILKNPITAFFGVGLGNFSSLFTLVKDAGYNSTSLWQISSFNVSRSALMQIFAEMGIIGFSAIGFIAYYIYQNFAKVDKATKMVVISGFAALLLMPASFVVYFIFFLSIAYFSATTESQSEVYVADLGKIMPIFVTTLVLFGVFIGGVTYFTSISFAAELLYKSAVDSLASNNLRGLYENQRKAILINPYNEEFRRSFAQTNLLIASNLASKKPEEVTNQDKVTISQAVQAAISEAKAAVSLNSNKVANWESLATTYQSIINIAQGADQWTIAAYQRATILDPQNPTYRFKLGSVYYLIKSYADAARSFETAVSLNPGWANAHYNLAWSYFQQSQYANAIRQLEQTIALVDKSKNAADYELLSKDLKTFQTKYNEVASNGKEQVAGVATPAASLSPVPQEQPPSLPTPPVATVEPKIELPAEASPSASNR